MEQGTQKLQRIAQQIEEDRDQGFAPSVPTVTPRELASWYGYERRSPLVVERLRQDLELCGLHTAPDFYQAGADERLTLSDSCTSMPPEDATIRVDSLSAAHNTPVSVTPEDDVSKAKTLMASNDFSQLPVMMSVRDLKGIITWKSIGSSANPAGSRVRHFMDDSVQAISGQRPLFEAVGIIADHSYVLVRGQDNRITGIVTVSDVNNQLLELTEAFLLVGEIESHVRSLIHCRFTREEVSNAANPSDEDAIDSIGNLTFGDYCRLLEEPERWGKLGLKDDRVAFVAQLQEVRRVRNEVMHFNFNRSSAGDIQKLRALAPFFRSRAYPPKS